jgi:hydroxylamine dehydrogenase
MRFHRVLLASATAPALFGMFAAAGPHEPDPPAVSACTECHEQIHPSIVSDWRQSRHGQNGIDCTVCHGGDHTTADDFMEARIPAPETCRMCHAEQAEQFMAGKHALAWTAMKAMPTTHALPMALTEGQKGCGGCHKIGVKNAEALEELQEAGRGYGLASCDACHTRHLFSVTEARQPQACQTCHMGFDHPQWEMYSSSKHGVRFLLKQSGVLPATASAPTCQSCHMQGGDHEVRTGWGFLAVRLPMPEDEQWAADRTTILQALGVLDPRTGEPTGRLELVRAADLARLTQEEWEVEREKMEGICMECHSINFARSELLKGDEMIREADHLLAEAIRVVAGLYRDGTLRKPADYQFAFPDLLTFHDAPTHIEQRLFEMHLKHRMRAFQGAFHSNPDYSLWYGWSEMVRDLQEIKEIAAEMRRH